MEVHDLSKYLPKEILGYYIRDCADLPHIPEERMLVTSAMQAHWQENDHHAGYYDPNASSRMSESALVEAVLNMVAHRL